MKKIIFFIFLNVLANYIFCQRREVLSDTISYSFLNEVIENLKSESETSQCYLLDKVSPEFVLLKKANLQEFRQLGLNDSLVERYFQYSSNQDIYFDSAKISSCRLVSFRLFTSLQTNKKLTTKNSKRKSKEIPFPYFPLYRFSKPYFFDNYCFISVVYFSGFNSGDYSVFLYTKEGGGWKLVQRVFRSVM